jgi:hypothetical protein
MTLSCILEMLSLIIKKNDYQIEYEAYIVTIL